MNSFFLNQEQNNYVVKGADDPGAKEKVKMMGTRDDVKDIGLKLGLAFLCATNTQQSCTPFHPPDGCVPYVIVRHPNLVFVPGLLDPTYVINRALHVYPRERES